MTQYNEELLDDMERRAMSTLRMLQERYRAEAKPIIDHLIFLKSLRPPKPVVIDKIPYDTVIPFGSS